MRNPEYAGRASRQGYIYVESYKEAHVREAIQGLRNIFGGKGAKLVPLAEMVDAVNVPRPSKALLGVVLRLRKPLPGPARGDSHLAPHADLNCCLHASWSRGRQQTVPLQNQVVALISKRRLLAHGN